MQRSSTRALLGSLGILVFSAACIADRSLPDDVGARTVCTAGLNQCPEDFHCPEVPDGVQANCLSQAEGVVLCGNGITEGTEECDDGNLISGDGCTAACELAQCGDGQLDESAGEACDDGNDNNNDTCISDCTLNVCGDGHRLLDVEVCDDGNTNSGDGCRGDCTKREECGDDFVDDGEACDDGNRVSGDGCAADCRAVEACGNGVVDFGEGCDCGVDDETLGPGCVQPNADRDDTQCLTTCQIPTCGDGLVGGLEQCEPGVPPDLGSADCTVLGFANPEGLGCTAQCTFDSSACTGFCGDGIRQAGELCDGDELGENDCTDFGFYDSLGLSCSAQCGFDTSACTGRCGDGVQNGAEQCDGQPPTGANCTDLGYYDEPGLACTPACALDASSCAGICGDGTLNGPEQCDGSDLGGQNCTDLGFDNAAGLACAQTCTFDTSACTGICGDGVQGGGEACDGDDLSDTDCTSFGFTFAAGLACTAQCGFDTGACTGFCGDGQRDGTEACDGADLDGQDCTGFGFYEAAGLGCTSTCAYDFTSCTGFCGDGVQNGSEDCDASDLGTSTCTDFGFYDVGGLACTATCGFDVSTCTGFCGDGVQNGSEDCDASDLGTGTCTDFGYYFEDTLACSPQCAFNTGACTGFCGDQVINGNEYCDTTAPAVEDCIDFGFSVGALDCSEFCSPGFGGCSRLGWVRSEIDTNQLLWDVWAANEDTIYAVGNGSSAFRFDGTVWTPITLPAGGNYLAVWGTGEDNVYITGSAGNLFRYDGNSWTTTNTGATTALLTGVHGSGPDDVWAIGYEGTVLHSTNGVDFTVINAGFSPTQFLRAVWAHSPNDVWVGGGNEPPRRFNGSSWSVPAGGPTSVQEIFGLDAGVTYVMNNNVAYRWDGSYTPLPGSSPPLSGGAIFALNENAVFTTGGFGAVGFYDGTVLTEMPSPLSAELNGLTLTPNGALIGVAQGGEVGRLDGSAVVEENGLGVSGLIWGMNDFEGNGLIATVRNTTTGEGIYQRNGTGFSPVTGSPTAVLNVFARSAGDIWAVGNNGLIEHYTAGSWVTEPSGSTLNLYGVWGAATGPVHAVGFQGIRTNASGTWQPSTVSTGAYFAVWGSAANNVIAVGDRFARYQGTFWATEPKPAGRYFGVHGSAADNVIAVGEGGVVAHYDGASWTPGDSGLTNRLYGVAVRAVDEALAVGISGGVTHFDGSRWRPVALDTIGDFHAVWSDGEMYHLGGDDDLTRFFHPARCLGAIPISCGEVVNGSTAGGATDLDGTSCGDSGDEGPERIYVFDPGAATDASVTLTGLSADLSLGVVPEDGFGHCDLGGRCLAESRTAGDESVTFTAAAAARSYVVVDGAAGVSGSFTLTLTCP